VSDQEKTPQENEETKEHEDKDEDDVEAHKRMLRPTLEAEEPDVEGHKLMPDPDRHHL
jgi:hypothetical protein